MQNTGYTQSSWNTLQLQISVAENLLLTSGYTQTQIDNARDALQTAINDLVLLPDTSELKALVLLADEIENDGYSRPTWTKFNTALVNAHSLLASFSYTADQVSYITNELSISMNNLRLLPDISELQALIDESSTLVKDAYTAASWQFFNNKFIQAILLIENGDYIISQIENMIKCRLLMNRLHLLLVCPVLSVLLFALCGISLLTLLTGL